jgi:biotin carboxyl carrier protein
MFKVKVNDESEYKIEFREGNSSQGTINEIKFDWDVVTLNNGEFNILSSNISYNARILNSDLSTKTLRIEINNAVFNLQVKDQFDLLLHDLGLDNATSTKQKEIKAPMPGLVLEILTKPGDVVSKGTSLLKLEAMKMENIIKSPSDGRIKKIFVNQKDAVEKNQTLIEFE